MNPFARILPASLLSALVFSVSACGSGGGSTPPVTLVTPTVTVTPASPSVTTAQSLKVSISVAGGSGTPTGSVVLSSGTYASPAATLSAGSATVTIAAGSLATGSDTLTARYTPDSASVGSYNSASGIGSVAVTSSTATPIVTVTPASGAITTAQSLNVGIAVTGSAATPSGSVVLSSGAYTSSSTALTSGSATITIPANSLAAGPDSLTATYTPDSASSPTYGSASGTATVTVMQGIKAAAVTVKPEEASLPFAENLIVTATVSDGSVSPTGSVTLVSGSFTSPAMTLSSGTATFYIQPGSLAKGSNTLTVTYAPDAGSSSTYQVSTGSATVTLTSAGSTNVTVNINTLANRRFISPYIYGINTMNTGNISGMEPALVRFGGNEASNYNWKLFTYNAGGDWFFEDFGLGGVDSVQLTSYTVGAGSHMLTTMPMLDWVSKESGHWSFSVAKFGPQCKIDPWNSDAGDGLKPDCQTPVTSTQVTDAYYPLVDTSGDCTTGNCLYRDDWTRGLAGAFGSQSCNVPYSSITSCHFYDLDNEPEIWDGSHRDVHPIHPGYTELSNLFETVGTNLKTWDPNAVRFGPVTCCWNYLWTAGPSGDDKYAHAGVDYLPWWLNQIYWLDRINGARTLDVVDIHAYLAVAVDTTNYTNAQKRAAAGNLGRTYWDPTYTIPGYDQDWITTTQPNRADLFLIPRLKALTNAIYPGTPLSFSEWEPFVVTQSEWDFATALSDADVWGVDGREGLSFSTRWGGPDATDTTTNLPHPNFQALKMYTDYDGAHHQFGSISVFDQNSSTPDLFTSYAALDASGTTMTIMVLNKDPDNAANVAFNLSGFSASTYTAYTLASTNPGAITASVSQAWNASQTFAPYSITLLVATGTQTSGPTSEWYLNPDDLMIPASGTGILNPTIMTGTASVALTSAVFDAFEGAPACSGTLALTDATITPATPATITVSPGSTPGFCHYTVSGNDGTSTQTEGGWIVVGKPAATLTVTSGNNQTAAAGTTLAQSLTVTLSPGSSGLENSGASILFSTSAGTLSNGTTAGTSVIATTNSSGAASVTLTLPAAKGPVTITAQEQFPMGGASVTFIATAN